MKYTLLISPKVKNSMAIQQARCLLDAILQVSSVDNPHEIFVFFYGNAVECIFDDDFDWSYYHQQNVSLNVCSSIVEGYLSQQLTPQPCFKIVGLGHWMDAIMDADKNIEFV
jgi:hypothetical protein